MTAPIAAFAARTWVAVDSAARTIMSSNFSRFSPPAFAMMSIPFVARQMQRETVQQTRQGDFAALFRPNLPQSPAKLTLSSAAGPVESRRCEQARGRLIIE